MSINCEWEVPLLKSQVQKLEEAVAKKHDTLYGNGHEGLTSRVRGVEDTIDRIESELKSIKAKIDGLCKQVFKVGIILAFIMGVLKIVPPDIVQMLFK